MTKGRLSNRGFDIDLTHARLSEDAFARVLRAEKVEVKDERKMGQSTGNVFIEYADADRPSGIRTTESGVWAFRLDDETWLVTSDTKIVWLVNLAFGEHRETVGGDFDLYSGVLVPIEWITRKRRA